MATTTPTPALPPPPGQTSDFSDSSPSLKGQMDIAMGVALPLVTIFFGLRCFTRLYVRRTWTFENWLVLLAYIGTVSECALGATVMDHHGGRHGWDITPEQEKDALHWVYIATINYGFTICIAKLAILILYRRIFSPRRFSPFDTLLVSLITILLMFYLGTNLAKIFECTPRAKIFDPELPGTCIDIPQLLNVSGIFNTVTDFVILLLPIKAVWGMQMTLKKKMTVVLVFTCGLCAPVFSLVGTIVREDGANSPDKSWTEPKILLWTVAELTTGVLCVSFPEMGPLLKLRRLGRGPKGPSASIVNGEYRNDDSLYRATGGSSSLHHHRNPFPTSVSHKISRKGGDPYIELDEVDSSQGGSQELHRQTQRGGGGGDGWAAHHDRQGMPGVTVTHEIEVRTSEVV
ncbi:hypothetical protein GGR56DRAFT_170518 [Xylariaceae sp. FL0804]|nr:hypothetical protein GGR56DRAFT_170518 [Xylariaceae sp. FL0804]